MWVVSGFVRFVIGVRASIARLASTTTRWSHSSAAVTIGMGHATAQVEAEAVRSARGRGGPAGLGEPKSSVAGAASASPASNVDSRYAGYHCLFESVPDHGRPIEAVSQRRDCWMLHSPAA